MADDWQLEAIREQFRVFNTLGETNQSIPLNWLTRAIKEIIDNHYVIRTKDRCKVLTEGPESITQTITKIKGFKANEQIEFCFIVIVNDHLSKIPIFVLQFEGKRIFIDIGCTVYYSWDAFMKNNNLPPTKFCLPVNGMYDVGKKLKIDFACSKTFYRHKFMLWGGLLVSATLAAGSFFLIWPAKMLTSVMATLVPIAETFIPNLSGAVNLTTEILKLIDCLKQGKNITKILQTVTTFCRMMNKQYSDAISEVWDDLKYCVRKAYSFLQKNFSSFIGARRSAQHRTLAITHAINDKVEEITKEASENLRSSEVYNGHRNHGNLMGNVLTQRMMVDDEENSSYHRQIFDNCRNNYTLNYGVNKKQDCELNETTCSLITTTEYLAKKYSCKSLDDVSNLLNTISQLVFEEYKRKIDNYKKHITAAKKLAAGHESDMVVEAYNQLMGIYGPPENHFWKETIQYISTSVFGAVTVPIEMRKKEIEAQQGVTLIQVLKKPGNINFGVFRCNGIRGRGKFSAGDLLSVIKEKIDFIEDEVVVTEKDDLLIIRCEMLVMVAYQVVDDDGNSEGLMLIDKANQN